jgi:bifunctional pyridoxal-dependent enzyme with beta-cystathionase and maltose regulon repressor activities
MGVICPEEKIFLLRHPRRPYGLVPRKRKLASINSVLNICRGFQISILGDPSGSL